MKKVLLLFTLVASFVVSNAQHIEFKWRGPYFVAGYSHGFVVGHSDVNTTMNGISGVFGFQFRRQSAAGIGFNYLSDPLGNFTQLPLFVEYRCHFLNSRFTPSANVYMGYTFPVGASETRDFMIVQGGITCGVSAGCRFAFTRKFGMSLDLGYQMLSMALVDRFDPEGNRMISESELFHFLKATVGFNF